jgi:hypothetical protein
MIVKSTKIWWNNYGLLVLLFITFTFFFMYWLMFTRTKDKGTYNKMSVPKYLNLLISEESKEKVVPKRKITSESKGELECRRVLEKIYKVPFPKARPDFLFNEITGQNLELDMFNPHLKLACEYNGKQHYAFNSFMHNNSHANFHNQKYRDEIKKKVCKKLGIYLIEVPYTVKIEEIEEFMISKLKNYNLIK